VHIALDLATTVAIVELFREFRDDGVTLRRVSSVGDFCVPVHATAGRDQRSA
jgi:hypothetical protein